MNISILGTESLGVRGLSCMVCTKTRRILIDPGIALGYLRHGRLPHPFQVRTGAVLRNTILHSLHTATDVVISHFHGDHIPLRKANPFQLSLADAAPSLATVRLHAPGKKNLPGVMLQRRMDLEQAVHHDIPDASGMTSGPLRFSLPVFHGSRGSRQGTVMMTRITDPETIFVHASDIQLLDQTAVDILLAWHPDIVLASGPPVYLNRLSPAEQQKAWAHAVELARGVDTLILDHHLLRCRDGIVWLDRLRQQTGRNVICAADFMKTPRCFLEAWRKELYEDLPVPEGWHEAYARGDADTSGYLSWRGWERPNNGNTQTQEYMGTEGKHGSWRKRQAGATSCRQKRCSLYKDAYRQRGTPDREPEETKDATYTTGNQMVSRNGSVTDEFICEKQEIEEPGATMVFGKKKYIPFVLAQSNLFFVGLRGSGKTTLGKAVAEKLGVPFLDMDAVIQEQAGESIREIVEQKGWETFRSLEEKALQEICSVHGRVIATGGGVVLSEANRKLLHQHGTVVYLMADPPVLARRVGKDQASAEQRPPLGKESLEQEMSNQLWEREPLYMMVANHTLQADKPGDELVQEVLAALWPENQPPLCGMDEEEK